MNEIRSSVATPSLTQGLARVGDNLRQRALDTFEGQALLCGVRGAIFTGAAMGIMASCPQLAQGAGFGAAALGAATGAAVCASSVIGNFKSAVDKASLRCLCGGIGGVAGGFLLTNLPALSTLGGIGFGAAIGGVAGYAVGSIFSLGTSK